MAHQPRTTYVPLFIPVIYGACTLCASACLRPVPQILTSRLIYHSIYVPEIRFSLTVSTASTHRREIEQLSCTTPTQEFMVRELRVSLQGSIVSDMTPITCQRHVRCAACSMVFDPSMYVSSGSYPACAFPSIACISRSSLHFPSLLPCSMYTFNSARQKRRSIVIRLGPSSVRHDYLRADSLPDCATHTPRRSELHYQAPPRRRLTLL